MDNLNVELFGIKLKNPLMLASGILGLSAPSLNLIAKDAGAVVTKSIGIKERRGYINPTVINWRCGLINAIGLSSPSAEDFLKELNKYTRKAPIFASIYGYEVDEYIEIVGILENSVNGFEINLSCPHVESLGFEIGSDPKLSYKIIKTLKKETDKPLLPKISVMHDYINLAKELERAGADAIVISNTIPGMKIDILSQRPILKNISGGVSGFAIKPIVLKSVFDLYKILDIPIIGCGGISTFEDVLEYILAGATAVQIGSSIFYSTNMFYSIKESLIAYLRKQNCKIMDLIGMAHNSTG